MNKKGLLLDLYYDFQNYKVENSSLGRSVEIDIVSSTNKCLLIGEAKLTKNKRTIKDYYGMLDDISVPPFANFKNKELYLFGTGGFDNNLLEIKDLSLHLVDLKTMFIEQ